MRITEMPGNYQAVYGEVSYKIEEAAAGELLEVAVYGNGEEEPLGLRRFRGDTAYTVNTAGYLQPLLELSPLDGATRFVAADGRTVQTWIRVGETVTDPVVLTGGSEDAGVETLLSHAPSRVRIAADERDELAVIAPGKRLSAVVRLYGAGSTAEIPVEELAAGSGMYVLVLQVPELLARAGGEWAVRCRRMEAEIRADGVVVACRGYEVVPQRRNSVRLCWLNALGAVDYYTFPEEAGRSLSVEKQRAYSREGYGVYGSQAEMEYVLRSEREPAGTMRWLAELACSPRVWRIDGDTAVPVDVVADRVKIRSSEPGLLEVTVRMPKRLVFQKDGWR